MVRMILIVVATVGAGIFFSVGSSTPALAQQTCQQKCQETNPVTHQRDSHARRMQEQCMRACRQGGAKK
jgi:hypothetical protein